MSLNTSECPILLDQALDRQPLQLPPDKLLSSAIASMTRAGFSYALIVQDQKLLGILTEGDVVRIAASEMSLEGVTISQVMTRNLTTLSIEKASNIFSVIALLRSARIRYLPITDNMGNLLGAIAEESLRQILKPANLLRMRRVTELMEAQVLTAPTTASVFQVAQLMAEEGASSVVICQSSDPMDAAVAQTPLKPVGIITERDIVEFKAAGVNIVQTPATSVMSRPVRRIKANASLWQAHQAMQEHHLRRLVVVDEGGYLVGIITQNSILQVLEPTEMYAAVEILQQTVASKTDELRQINEQMQQEVVQRKRAQEELKQLNQGVEALVRSRTEQLLIANQKLAQELATKNQKLQQAHSSLKTTQSELWLTFMRELR